MDDELSKSELGTKQYWDDTYERELKNFSDTGDVGEIWFGEDSVDRVVNWLEKCDSTTNQSSILDLGCGNGVLLIELWKNGYKNLTGVDYSQSAIELAAAVAKEQEADIKYQTCDIVSDLPASDSCLCSQYDICVDKGTYDAISLHPEHAAVHRQKYRENLKQLLKEGGLFILTSCNWTEEELKQYFNQDLVFIKKIPTPSFQFGGKTGNRETVLVFKKKSS